MSAAPHTPGPWYLERGKDGLWDIFGVENDGSDVTRIYIAEIGACMLSRHSRQKDQNASLIAAAPDLLAFARKIAAADFSAGAEHRAIARDLIAKAEGR